ncbi:MAG: hypothetical protein R6V86_02230, partial [Spirochaetia bacterium]
DEGDARETVGAPTTLAATVLAAAVIAGSSAPFLLVAATAAFALLMGTTVDPIRDGRNWYSYVENDPVNRIDPLGLLSDEGNTSGSAEEPYYGRGSITGRDDLGSINSEEKQKENNSGINYSTVATGFAQVAVGTAGIVSSIATVANACARGALGNDGPGVAVQAYSGVAGFQASSVMVGTGAGNISEGIQGRSQTSDSFFPTSVEEAFTEALK